MQNANLQIGIIKERAMVLLAKDHILPMLQISGQKALFIGDMWPITSGTLLKKYRRGQIGLKM